MLNRASRPDRRHILSLGFATHLFAVAMPMAAMPVLVNEISGDLGLSLVEIGSVWAASSLANAFISLPSGLIGDRFGVKRVLSISCLLAGLGIITKGLSNGFLMLAVTTFLSGLITSIIPVNVHKTVSIWFQGSNLGRANGVVSLGFGLGMTLGAMISATLLSPWLGGWRNVMYLYGGMNIIIGLIWLMMKMETSSTEPAASSSRGAPFLQTLSKVAHIKEVWLLGLIAMGRTAAMGGVSGYLALYLERYRGWSLAGADSALAMISIVSSIAVLPVAIISDRLRSRMAIILPGTLAALVGIGLFPIANPAMIWLLVILLGIFSDGYMAVFITMIQETRGVGPQYSGTAMGLVFALAGIVSSVTSPISYSLASINPNFAFIFWTGLVVFSLAALLYARNTGQLKTNTASPGENA